MKQFIFSIICSLLLIGCGGKSVNSSPDTAIGLPCDTAWMVSRGQGKTDVRNLFLHQGLRLQEREAENVIIGVGNKSIHWVETDWDVVSCRFDDGNKATSVTLLRSGELGDSLYNVVYELSRIYGEAELDLSNSDKTWRFINTHNTNASITSDRNIEVNIVWE